MYYVPGQVIYWSALLDKTYIPQREFCMTIGKLVEVLASLYQDLCRYIAVR